MVHLKMKAIMLGNKWTDLPDLNMMAQVVF